MKVASTVHCHSRFKAFFRFSTPTFPGAAVLLTALEAVPSVPTFESAVASGEGDVTRSLLSLGERDVDEQDGRRAFSGEDCSVCDGDIGGIYLRVEEVDGIAIACAGSGALGAAMGSPTLASKSFASAGWNSGGFVRGVAWTLVMSFAREK